MKRVPILPAVAPRADRVRDRDRGSALPMVLVFMVISAFVVLPLMSFAMSVINANTVLSDKAQRFESVKAGLRTVLYDPLAVYRECDNAGEGAEKSLDGMFPLEINGHQVHTTCRLIGLQKTAVDDHLRYGLVATRVGETAPPELKGKKYPGGTLATDWTTITTANFEDTDDVDVTDKIWLPTLPTYPVTVRDPDGFDLPPGYGGCKVYFPGKYLEDVVLDGPAFFASGVYYFEGTVEVRGGADVVVGDGRVQGCATSQQAVFDSIPALSTDQPHNITGFGATWLFGGDGRLVVSNQDGPVRFQFNRRYVDDPATDPSLFLSIASVNGQMVDDDIDELVVYDGVGTAPENEVLHVPVSAVAGANPNPLAQGMTPSTHTIAPVAPAPPIVSAPAVYRTGTSTGTANNGLAYLTWQAPPVEQWGGLPLDRYEVRIGNSVECSVSALDGSHLECLLTGLPGSSGGTTTEVQVVAINSQGIESDPVVVPVFVKNGTSTSPPRTPAYTAPTISVPSKPATGNRFNGAFRVSVPSNTAGSLPITGYTLTAVRKSGSGPASASCDIDPRTTPPPAMNCIIRGLNSGATYSFRATVHNLYQSVQSSETTTPHTQPTGLTAPADPAPPSPPTPPDVPPYEPLPIVDLDLQGGDATEVRIPGAVAVPQGTFRVENPNGYPVRVIGGVMAAEFEVNDGRVASQACQPPAVPVAGENCVDLGFEAEAIQVRLRIESSIPGVLERSVAIVQINENGATAVNSWEVQ